MPRKPLVTSKCSAKLYVKKYRVNGNDYSFNGFSAERPQDGCFLLMLSFFCRAGKG